MDDQAVLGDSATESSQPVTSVRQVGPRELCPGDVVLEERGRGQTVELMVVGQVWTAGDGTRVHADVRDRLGVMSKVWDPSETVTVRRAA
jgi:hypothetical protein